MGRPGCIPMSGIILHAGMILSFQFVGNSGNVRDRGQCSVSVYSKGLSVGNKGWKDAR